MAQTLLFWGASDAIIGSIRVNGKQLSKEVRKCHTNFAQHTKLTKEGRPQEDILIFGRLF